MESRIDRRVCFAFILMLSLIRLDCGTVLWHTLTVAANDTPLLTTCQDASRPAPFCLSPSPKLGVLQPSFSVFDCCMLRPDCLCWSAYWDAFCLAPSSLSPSPAPGVLWPPPIGPLSHMLGLSSQYCPKSPHAPDQVFSSLLSLPFRTGRWPQLYSLFSMRTMLLCIVVKPILSTTRPHLGRYVSADFAWERVLGSTSNFCALRLRTRRKDS